MAAELHAANVPDTIVDQGWDHNITVELRYAPYINSPSLATAANPYTPAAAVPAGTCTMFFGDNTPHIHPVYGVSFEPNVCAGAAPFAPIHYSRWLASQPGTLYVVRYPPLPGPSLSPLLSLRDDVSNAQIRLDHLLVSAIAEQSDDPLDMLRRMKFEAVGFHPIEGYALNIVEQINQTWMFCVALATTRQLLILHPDVDGFRLAPGANACQALDIRSVTEACVGAETYAAVAPQNNGKLALDLLRLVAFQAIFRIMDMELQPTERTTKYRNRFNTSWGLEITESLARGTKNGNAKYSFVRILGTYSRWPLLQT